MEDLNHNKKKNHRILGLEERVDFTYITKEKKLNHKYGQVTCLKKHYVLITKVGLHLKSPISSQVVLNRTLFAIVLILENT